MGGEVLTPSRKITGRIVNIVPLLLLLAAIACISGKTPLRRFCFFMIAFGTWDIFYYIWLWVMIRWPESLMTWDLLFLLPLPWVGPVITPVLS